MTDYTGYGSEVIMDKVDSLPTIGAQIALLRDVFSSRANAEKMGNSPRFHRWLSENAKAIAAANDTTVVEETP